VPDVKDVPDTLALCGRGAGAGATAQLVNRLIAARAGDKPCGADEFFPALLYTVLKVEVSLVCSAFFSLYTALLYTVLKVDLCALL
jgi:hypothetical protein